MSTIIHAKLLNRGLTTGFVNAGRTDLEELRLPDLIEAKIPERGAIVGKWRRDADPFPDILIVRDNDLSDVRLFFHPSHPFRSGAGLFRNQRYRV
jgi:hypothetical protein